MAEPLHGAKPDDERPPRVPAHAWTWLQRSRPVLSELSHLLYGTPPDAGVLDRIRRDHATDPFVRDLVARVVCDVAFAGRVPRRRPAGATWDRGLVWWAAHLAGTTPEVFDASAAGRIGARQGALFEEPTGAVQADRGRARANAAPGSRPSAPTPVDRLAGPPATGLVDRAAVVDALRSVLDAGDGEQVPASAIRQLLAELER